MTQSLTEADKALIAELRDDFAGAVERAGHAFRRKWSGPECLTRQKLLDRVLNAVRQEPRVSVGYPDQDDFLEAAQSLANLPDQGDRETRISAAAHERIEDAIKVLMRGARHHPASQPHAASPLKQEEGAVAWRYHYYGDGRPVRWTLTTRPPAARQPKPGWCGVVVEPLYTHPASSGSREEAARIGLDLEALETDLITKAGPLAQYVPAECALGKISTVLKLIALAKEPRNG